MLQIQYIFASEEYPEYVGDFNDPMAIFVSTNRVGTNWINSLTNDLALVPGTTNLPVSVNTVNATNNAQYYVDNGDPIYSANTPVFNTQYDGLTINLTAQIFVLANVTNHVKIAIADNGGVLGTDDIYDSAVFIKTPISCP